MKLKSPQTVKESLARLSEAEKRLRPYIKVTDLNYARNFSQETGIQTFLKLENTQMTGSFKIRGAINKLSSLSDSEKSRGVIASSAGNHSQGVAFGAQKLAIEADIVMPETSSLTKITGTKSYGANVILHGTFYDEAYDHALELAEKKKRLFIHPYQDDLIIAGQGTVGLEILQQLPDVDLVLVPIGGGGLISGISMAIKSQRPQCRIVGVQTERVPTTYDLFYGNQTERKALVTIADGIAVKSPSQSIYEEYLKKYVDDIVTVSEDEIAASMVWLLEKKKTVVEGAGAVAMAALMYREFPGSQNAVVVLSGGNVDLNTISKVIQRGLLESKRQAQISVIADDFPGTLNKISAVIGEQRANILQVEHSRAKREIGLRETRIDFLLETIDEAHIEDICKALKSLGIKVVS